MAPQRDATTAGTLRRELVAVGDDKISKIVAVVDQTDDAEVNRALLDPVRARLASLRPVRPLRFSRLLFTPLDPLIVPPRNWHATDCRVPRTIIAPVSRLVQSALGTPSLFVAQTIAGQTVDAVDAITQAGEVLWPLAADILAAALMPDSWAETALPAGLFQPLMAAIATVLRRAPQLRRLQLNADAGMTDRDESTIGSIMAGLAEEPLQGATMITQLILVQVPHTAPVLRKYVSATVRETAEAVLLNKALAQGVEASLDYLESEADFDRSIKAASLRAAAEQVRMTASLLMAIENDASAVRHRPRIRIIKDRLDQASRACFSNGLKSQLVDRLAARTGQEQQAEQQRLEASARELRMLAMAARRFSDWASYERQLLQASKAVQEALAASTINTVRGCRLIEILLGPEVAEALYRSRMK